MEPLVLPMIELMRGVLSVADGGMFGLALILVGYAGAVVVRRRARGADRLALVEEDSSRAKPPRTGIETEIRNPDQPPEVPGIQRINGKLATVRWALRGLGLASMFVAGSLLVIENYGAEPILNWSLSKLEARTGIKLTFAKATGGLLSGQLVLRQVQAVRENHAESNFDLSCSQVTVRFSLCKIIFQEVGLQELRIDQISGSYHRLGSASKTPKPETVNFPVGHLQLNDATIDFKDSTVEGEPIQFGLAVKSLDCSAFRTAFAPYDVFFRSNVDGTIENRSFKVRTTRTELGPRTEWRVTGLPIRLVGSYLGGPFRWLREGECYIDVEQQMRDTPRGPVTLDAHLVLRNIKPGVPGDIKPAVAIATQLLMTQLKGLPKEKDLKFTLNLDPEKFDLTSTENAAQLWQQFKAAAIASLLQNTGVNVEGLPDAVQEKLDNAVESVAKKALKALENIRERRKAKKAEKEKQSAPENP